MKDSFLLPLGKNNKIFYFSLVNIMINFHNLSKIIFKNMSKTHRISLNEFFNNNLAIKVFI